MTVPGAAVHSGPDARLTLSPHSGPPEVEAQLRADGVAVLPARFGPAELAALRLEHDRIVQTSSGGAVPQERNGLGAIARRDLPRYPALQQAFEHRWVHEVVRRYLGPRAALNERIVCTHERRALQPITAPHFDTLRSLKFLVYLLDTDERNGAFRFAPGTHLANAEASGRWRADGGRVRETPNVATDEEAAALRPMTGPAGTLVVFDSDGFHSGGVLQPGTERRVVRAQSYPWPRLHLQPRRLSLQWFREADWSPLRRARPVPTRPATAGHSRVRAAPPD